MIPIQINNNQYYYKNIIDEYSKSIFFKKIEKDKIIKKRKFIFFGKVIEEKVVKKITFEYCFEFYYLDYTFLDDEKIIKQLKLVESNYQKKCNFLEGNTNI